MNRWLMVLLSLTTGCTAQRYLTLPNERPATTTVSLPEVVPGQTWRVGEISTRVEAASGMQGWGAGGAANLDTDQLKAQLTDRVRSTLTMATALGAIDGPAVYSLEVDLVAKELYGFGRGLPLGLALETGILLAGAGAGAGIGHAIDSSRGQDRLSAVFGMSIGLLAAIPAALLAAFATDLGAVRGEYGATLTLRRRADRVPVATRRLSSAWRTDYNAFGVEAKLAKQSGDAVLEFERVILEGVKSMLIEVNEPLATAR